MANNRMYFACVGCEERMQLASYYPNTGWDASAIDPNHMEYFIEQHGHCAVPHGTSDGEGMFALEYE